MPGLQPLPVATLVAIGVLLGTVAALWLRPRWLWAAGVCATIVAGYAAGILEGAAAAAFPLLAYALIRCRSATGWPGAAYGAIVVLVSLLLGLHLVPGVHNPVVIRDAVLSSAAVAYTQHANLDKGLAGVLTLGILGMAALRSAGGGGAVPPGARGASPEWGSALRRAAPIVLATLALSMLVSLALGVVRVDPRWTPLFWVWAPINLLLTCASEEAFFRRFLQGEVHRALDGRSGAAGMAVATSAVLFGLAHAAGGWRYVLLATLAGTGYALAFQRSGRIELAILTHFAVNATHFLLFTYPALA